MKGKWQKLIADEHRLESATTRFGSPIHVYDDGFGPLFIHRDSMGIRGIVRAQTWEEAYNICEDEFFPEADETDGDFTKEFGPDWPDNDCWNEQYGFRPNGGIYVKDLNGDRLDTLDAALAEELEIHIFIEPWEGAC